MNPGKTLFCAITPDNPPSALQPEINKVARWAEANKMSISVPKCAVIKTKPDAHVYLLNGRPIPEVSSYKDLGVHWDNDMKFRTHITEMAKSNGRLTQRFPTF